MDFESLENLNENQIDKMFNETVKDGSVIFYLGARGGYFDPYGGGGGGGYTYYH